jgi:Core-2/I-Branching enzyme
MPVFAVLAHTEPEILQHLVAALAPYRVVVHIDRRANAADFSGLPRTTYIKDRIAVNWGGYSIVEATVRMFDVAHRMVAPDDHIVLLSGQCYPVRPIDEFVQHLHCSPWKQHCKSALVFDGSKYSERRLTRNWYWDDLPLRRSARSRRAVSAVRRVMGTLAKRRNAADFAPLIPVRGSQWIALTQACIQDLLPVAHSSEFMSLFKQALAPDEMFFHTLVYNSSWRSEMEFPNLMPEVAQPEWEFANFHSPFQSRPLTLADLAAIRSADMYFARKFSGQEGLRLMEELRKAT